jgi:photosystem II stability/assembly factor-like uncharacterized protein
VFHDHQSGVLVGDSVQGRIYTELISRRGWSVDENACAARPGEGAFAASNSNVFVFGSGRYIIATGASSDGPRALLSPLLAYGNREKSCLAVSLPMAGGGASSGAFSLAFRDRRHAVVVGGDYRKPDDTSGTAAWTTDGGRHWTAAARMPHGFRSAVAWYAPAKGWIAAGPNGSDISRDGGRTWQPLDNGNWNALSLPYVVGPKGRIAKLRPDAIQR